MRIEIKIKDIDLLLEDCLNNVIENNYFFEKDLNYNLKEDFFAFKVSDYKKFLYENSIESTTPNIIASCILEIVEEDILENEEIDLDIYDYEHYVEDDDFFIIIKGIAI